MKRLWSWADEIITKKGILLDIQFVVRLCNDILFDVIRFGNRRQLIELQRIGRHFQRFIDRNFRGSPLLILNLLQINLQFVFLNYLIYNYLSIINNHIFLKNQWVHLEIDFFVYERG